VPPDQCLCTNSRLVWSTVGTAGNPLRGPRQLRKQCTDCGRLLAGAVAHAWASTDTPGVDLVALRRWNVAEDGYWRERRIANAEARAALAQERREEYRRYLQSDEWASRRELVLQRADYLCEGCRLDRATEVHHLSYDHLGQEFLWELVAVCRRCHAEWHSQEPVAIGNQVRSA
jgi:5-methylcytosine-specific restriction endonuclease McrA